MYGLQWHDFHFLDSVVCCQVKQMMCLMLCVFLVSPSHHTLEICHKFPGLPKHTQHYFHTPELMNVRSVCQSLCWSVTASSFLPCFLSLCPCVSRCFTNCQGRLKNYPFNLLTKERGSNFSGPEIGGVSHPLLETKYNARSRQIRTNYRAVQMIVNFQASMKIIHTGIRAHILQDNTSYIYLQLDY